MSSYAVVRNLAIVTLCLLGGCSTPNSNWQRPDRNDLASDMLAEVQRLRATGDLTGAQALASRAKGLSRQQPPPRPEVESRINRIGHWLFGHSKNRTSPVPSDIYVPQQGRKEITTDRRASTTLKNDPPHPRWNPAPHQDQQTPLTTSRQLPIFDSKIPRYTNDEPQDATLTTPERVLLAPKEPDLPLARSALQKQRTKQIGHGPTDAFPPLPYADVVALRSSALDQILPGFGHSQLRAPDPRHQPLVDSLGVANPQDANRTIPPHPPLDAGKPVASSASSGFGNPLFSTGKETSQESVTGNDQVHSASRALVGLPAAQPSLSPAAQPIDNANHADTTAPQTNPVQFAGVAQSASEINHAIPTVPYQSDLAINPSGLPTDVDRIPASGGQRGNEPVNDNRSVVSQWSNALLDQMPRQQTILQAPAAGIRSALNSARQEIRNGLSRPWFALDQSRGVANPQTEVANLSNPDDATVHIQQVGNLSPVPDIQRLIEATETEVSLLKPGPSESEQQGYLAKHVQLRMLYLVAGRNQRTLDPIPNIDPVDQEFWQQIFWGISNYFDQNGMPNASDRATETIAQLTSAIVRLREKAKLELRNVTFCHKIVSYGSYERFKKDVFSPGQPVLLYSEVGNFKSETTPEGQQRTVLKSRIEIFQDDEDGDLVDRIDFAATEDLCNSSRRDYFHSYEFNIPQNAALGPHVVKLTVEDQLSQKVASYSLHFTVE